MPKPETQTSSLEAHMATLPLELRSALLDNTLSQRIASISRANNFNLEQANLIEKSTVSVLLGWTYPADFLERLSFELLLPKERVAPLVDDIDEHIFMPVAGGFLELYGEEINDEDSFGGEDTETSYSSEESSSPGTIQPTPPPSAVFERHETEPIAQPEGESTSKTTEESDEDTPDPSPRKIHDPYREQVDK